MLLPFAGVVSLRQTVTTLFRPDKEARTLTHTHTHTHTHTVHLNVETVLVAKE